MKKNLIAFGLMAAFAVPAFAEVTVYGTLRTGLEYSSVSGKDSVDRFRLIDDNSRIGFKGGDKLDNGMSLFWKSEHTVRIGSRNPDGTNDSRNGWGARDQYIGLGTTAGTFTFGKQNDSYGDWVMLDPVLDGTLTASEDSALYQWESGQRHENIAKYVSPVFGGVQASLSYDFGHHTADYNNRGYSTLLTWSNDRFGFGGAYIRQNDASPYSDYNGNYTKGEKFDGYMLGGNVKLTQALTVSGHWERAEYSQIDYTRDYFGIGANYAIGRWGFNTMVLKANESELKGVKQDDGAIQYNASVRYSLSKSTTAIANYTYLKNDSNGQYITANNLGGEQPGQRANVVNLTLRTDF